MKNAKNEGGDEEIERWRDGAMGGITLTEIPVDAGFLTRRMKTRAGS